MIGPHNQSAARGLEFEEVVENVAPVDSGGARPRSDCGCSRMSNQKGAAIRDHEVGSEQAAPPNHRVNRTET